MLIETRDVLLLYGRPFTFMREAFALEVVCFLQGKGSAELMNSAFQADALMIIDAEPLTQAGVPYLLRFDRLVSSIGEQYTVQQSRVAFAGDTALFHKAFVRGATS